MSSPIVKRPGRIFLEPVRKVGRKKNLGSIAWIAGHMVVTIGYSEDGMTCAYATPEQILSIQRGIRRATGSPLYRMLKMLLSRYETNR